VLPPELAAMGYQQVYSQTGSLESMGLGRPMQAEQYIWARRDLLRSLGELVPMRVTLSVRRSHLHGGPA
jgi:hypothetical protein